MLTREGRPAEANERDEAIERAEKAERDLDQLAREVGKALLVLTLQPGEELADPGEHAIVSAMNKMRRERDEAREEASRWEDSSQEYAQLKEEFEGRLSACEPIIEAVRDAGVKYRATLNLIAPKGTQRRYRKAVDLLFVMPLPEKVTP